ncbi:hypothetical protein TWF481_006167 [Arthrobotrys musiformis]|uniref:Extracellular membrane protein CFEM domain-containing protein n=1 Tax=Arthrobotrys musiformis TaxID=47236 RepID=A0AAV9WHX3_9PEZI
MRYCVTKSWENTECNTTDFECQCQSRRLAPLAELCFDEAWTCSDEGYQVAVAEILRVCIEEGASPLFLASEFSAHGIVPSFTDQVPGVLANETIVQGPERSLDLSTIYASTINLGGPRTRYDMETTTAGTVVEATTIVQTRLIYTPPPSDTAPAEPISDKSSKLTTGPGVVTGIAIGLGALFILVAICLYVIYRLKAQKRTMAAMLEGKDPGGVERMGGIGPDNDAPGQLAPR